MFDVPSTITFQCESKLSEPSKECNGDFIDSDTIIKIELDDFSESECFITSVTQPKNCENLDENLISAKSEGTTKDNDSQLQEKGNLKGRKDVIWKNFVRRVRRHYTRSFRSYLKTYAKISMKNNIKMILYMITSFFFVNQDSIIN